MSVSGDRASTDQMSLSDDERREWADKAWFEVDDDEIRQLVVDMVNIYSPPGEERELASFMVQWLESRNIPAHYQTVDDRSGNAIGNIVGTGGGARLLFWGELDTSLGLPGEGRLGMGDASRPELRPEAVVDGDQIVGLGAENPKGHTACAAIAAAALRRADVPFLGDLVLGFPGGGMPTNAWDPSNPRKNIAHGAGCEFMLQQGLSPDFAVAAKPVYAVSHEEAGIVWFRVSVGGTASYAGIRHVFPYDSAILNAAHLVIALEEWFPIYAEVSRSGTIAPQGVIGAIEGGIPQKPAFTPDICHLYVDMRINLDQTPMDAQRELDCAIARAVKARPGLRVHREMILSIPGSRTEPDNWIVQSLVRAWEHVEGRPHSYDWPHSGATDVNVLRAWGVPVARLGFPQGPAPDGRDDLPSRMGAVDIQNMKRLIRCLIEVAVDTCTRPTADVGLPEVRPQL